MSSGNDMNWDRIFYQPEVEATVDLFDVWNPVNDTVDPQQLNTTLTLVENHASNPTQASESINSIPTADQKPATPIAQRPGKRLSLASVRVLNKWLTNHTHHPYPTVAEVESIIRQTGLSKQQVLNWFANARRRKKFASTVAPLTPRLLILRRIIMTFATRGKEVSEPFTEKTI
ncbi:hypothetical protein FVEN_g730 [Fusarium venenatum]|uniref:homeobox KN domain-containing protein n=1 Tax=Fusarium venenatum TaxID=56646 RepID=UPI001D4C16AA|nr:hypothetical protein FVEN_g730 [Fusarium venenatum]KAH6967442.1 homeobox KN domain-containing protein [Fusarium venenatum]